MSESSRPASGEDSLIARYFKPLAKDPGAFNLDDDAAALRAGADRFLPKPVTPDVLLEAIRESLSALIRRDNSQIPPTVLPSGN